MILRQLCSFLLLAGALTAAPSAALAQDMIVADLPAREETEGMTETETETEGGPLVETETVYEVPYGITDGLKKDTPAGEAQDMTMEECSAFLSEVYQANSAKEIWEKHENVAATFRLFDEDAQLWKEYAATYRDPVLYYSDDWTPGLEELRLLMYGENACVEDYTGSLRFVCFLNASGTPYRDPLSDPVTLDEDTKEETLLNVLRTPEALYVITQLTESSILSLGLDEPEGDAFYSCLYLLDPSSLEVQLLQICLHGGEDAGSQAKEVRNVSFSYDHGMTPFIETGYRGLLCHLVPGSAWEPEDLREVTVTLDPGTDGEVTYLLTALKGDPVSYTLPDGYELYSDEALTARWTDDGNYTSDLALWAAKPS